MRAGEEKNTYLLHMVNRVLNEILSFFESVTFLFLTRAVSEQSFGFKTSVDRL